MNYAHACFPGYVSILTKGYNPVDKKKNWSHLMKDQFIIKRASALLSVRLDAANVKRFLHGIQRLTQNDVA